MGSIALRICQITRESRSMRLSPLHRSTLYHTQPRLSASRATALFSLSRLVMIRITSRWMVLRRPLTGRSGGKLPETEQSLSKDPSRDAHGSVVGTESPALLTGPSMALNLEPFVPEPEELYIPPPPIPQNSDDLVASKLIEKKEDAPKYWIDTLGRPYPLDQYGNIVRTSNRPYGVPKEDWKKASKAMRRRYRAAFADLPPRPEVAE